jgi:arsenate reductase (thioredoxin)
MSGKQRVLILCTGNSARSQMAEGVLRHDAGDRFEVASAGTSPSQVRAEAIRVMNELGIDISRHRSKSVDEFAGQEFDYVLTVCDQARETCPIYPGHANRLHRSFEDPVAVEGSEEQRMNAFRKVRDEIRSYLRTFPDKSVERVSVKKKRVLFLCTGNSARSQMAEALLRHIAGDKYDIVSAGTRPKGVHPTTIEVMKEVKIDIRGHTSKDVQQFLDQKFDYVITVCDRAKQQCPVFPGAEPIHWGFDDPAEVPVERQIKNFRRVREEIMQRLRLFVLSNHD